MRRSWIVAVAGTALLCLAPITAAGAHPSATTGHAVQRIVVRPVTASGHAVPGYRVTTSKGTGPVDCSDALPSLAAVDDDIIRCAPDADGVNACWRAAHKHHVLCLHDARKHTLVKYRTTGRIAHTKAPDRRGPLNLKLADGLYCDLRSGGAGSSLRQHPNWSAFYYCTHGKAVWAPLNAKNFGIHRSNGHVWTVEVAVDSGKKHVHQVHVTSAYLVGTA